MKHSSCTEAVKALSIQLDIKCPIYNIFRDYSIFQIILTNAFLFVDKWDNKMVQSAI